MIRITAPKKELALLLEEIAPLYSAFEIDKNTKELYFRRHEIDVYIVFEEEDE